MSQKIAYIVSRFPHLPETFILREMVELERQGTQVELFSLVLQQQEVMHAESRSWLQRVHHAGFFSKECRRANWRTFCKLPGRYLATFFSVVAFNIPSLKFLVRAIYIFPVAVWMAEEIRARQVDHIHAHYATHPALAAWIIYRFTGISFSFTVHAHDIYVNRTMLRRKLADANFIRAISEFNKQFLIQHYGDWVAAKTVVIHCGIRPEMYQKSAAARKNTFQIIAVGSLQEYKGHAYLIQACRMLLDKKVDFRCAVIGGGKLSADLQRMIEKLNLTEHVALLGPKTEKEVAQLLSRADCFVLPSVVIASGKMEGIPVVLMEALASRLPVVATRISGIPELIMDKQTGLLVPQRDSSALMHAIVWMNEHPQEASRMADTGCKKVIIEFNLVESVTRLRVCFSELRKTNQE
jgi:glycosyltransferase involved in cell wall biosynthesis